LLIQFPFQLEALPHNRSYESLALLVEFTDARVTALDAGASGPSGHRAMEDIRLDIRGIGCDRIAWDLHPTQSTRALRPRSHIAHTVVDAPPDLTCLRGTLWARAMISYRIMGIIDRVYLVSSVSQFFAVDIQSPIGLAGTAKPTSYSGPIKVAVCRRLQGDWRDLADYFDIPGYDRATFIPGREPFQIWNWLAERGRLSELSSALQALKRSDLTELLDAAAPDRLQPPSTAHQEGP